MPSRLPSTVRLTPAPPWTGTLQMSQLSEMRTNLPSFDQPNGRVGGLTTLWSSSVLTNEVGVSLVTL